MERRRQRYWSYSPVFWRPASGVTALHAGFLGSQIARDDVVAFRTGSGFVMGETRGGEGFIDDFAVEPDKQWEGDGRRLLAAAWERLHAYGALTVRVVSAQKDLPKNTLLSSVGLSVADEWWVKALVPSGRSDKRGTVRGSGFSGYLGPAPPVYDPGGDLLLVRYIDPEVPVDDMERQAASWGAVLAVVPAVPDGARARELSTNGYEVASQWFVGVPA